VDHPLCLMQAQPQQSQRLPHGPDGQYPSVVQLSNDGAPI
jgi:hypothetical protein